MRLPFLLMSTLLAMVTVTAPSEACDCLWQGPFTEVQAETDLVVSGTIVATKGNSIDLEIERLMRGKEFMPDIRIWLKTGALCRPDAETFPVGSQWVMALSRISDDVPGGFNPSTPNVSFGRTGDYSLSSCGGYWLNLTHDLVTGNLAGGTRWEMDPKMQPVILDLIESFVQGKVDSNALAETSKEDPLLREMMLDTKSFIREERYGINDDDDAADDAEESTTEN